MTALRLVSGICSLTVASVLLAHFVAALPVLWPTMRQLGQEQTTYFVLRLAGFSLSGWQILAVETIVLLVAIGLILLAVYELMLGKPMA